MKQIESLYKKLVVEQDASNKKAKIDDQIRSKLHKMILEELQKLRKKQQKTDYVSEKYDKIDHEIRALLLKEIQVILDEYVLAQQNNDLKSWKEMYGNVAHYINNFFYYRMDGTYESKKKTLKDYKFLEDE